jgi:hypothetical protein
MKNNTLAVMASCAMLLWGVTAQARPTPPPPNPTLVCQQSKLAVLGGLQPCLALNSANILTGARDNSEVCYQNLTEALALIDTAASRAGTSCRYLDNHDGTVSDLDTGLMWEKKSPAGTGDVHDVDNLYTLSTGATTADGSILADDGTAYTMFLAVLNNGSAPYDGGHPSPVTGCFANHCDWRLPTIVELQGIVNTRYFPAIDPIFGPTQPNFYWSITDYQVFPNGFSHFTKWLAGFNGGGAVTFEIASIAEFVRAVRSGM